MSVDGESDFEAVPEYGPSPMDVDSDRDRDSLLGDLPPRSEDSEDDSLLGALPPRSVDSDGDSLLGALPPPSENNSDTDPNSVSFDQFHSLGIALCAALHSTFLFSTNLLLVSSRPILLQVMPINT